MLTRKDYEQIARAFQIALMNCDTTPEACGVERAIDAMIPMLHASNPRFDEQRFREACHESV